MENTKVGLITFYKDNFGSILQCYATKAIVNGMGFDCIVLGEPELSVKNKNRLQKKYKKIKFIISNILEDPSFYKRWKKMRKQPAPLMQESWNLMDQFVNEYISPEFYTIKELEIEKDTFHAFIVGSDQVWNVNNDISPFFFLKFAPRNKIIPFSVSFGVDKPSSKFLSIVKDGVEGLKKISVREETGKKILSKVSEAAVVRVGDPTLMLNKNEWEDFCKDAAVPEEDFILLHFLNCPSDLALKYIQKYNNMHNVICIAYKYEPLEMNGWKFVNCGPKEYLAYIKNAKVIYTDSFHTTLFSINLEKEFYTFERQYLHGYPQTSRLIDLLKRFNLTDRFIKTINDKPFSNITTVQPKVAEECQQTKDYLMRELEAING